MQIDGAQPTVPSIPTKKTVGMPLMATQHAEVEKVERDTIFSTLPTLQTLPTLTIIDNLSRGVE